ncbi:hypothetical protein SDC9_150386 [bioreactor metagenome]|uniref:Uncharacterized protein n=1 Tax=bioreactor metagenome TaxID=1076179 RepID=A0A645EMC1_9ZZZZ
MVSGFAMIRSDEVFFFASLEKIGEELYGEWNKIYPIESLQRD